MKGRDKLLFNLLTVLLFVTLVLVLVKTRESDKQIKQWQTEMKRRQERGVQDPQLRETVDKLESELRARLSDTFVLDEDPLDLTRVIKTRKFLEKVGLTNILEGESRMRLSATVLSPESEAAVIQFRGRSHMLQRGGEISGYRVVSISSNSALLRRGAEDLRLYLEKAPDSKAEEEARVQRGQKVSVEIREEEVQEEAANNW